MILFGWLCCSWSSFLLVYSKANPSVLRRTLIPNLNLLVSCLFSNNPCQELCKPPRRLPLPLLPMVTTTLTTITASKPRGNHCRRMTGCRLPSPRHCCPCHPGQGGGERAQNTAPCRSQDRAANQSDGGFLVFVIVVGGSAGETLFLAADEAGGEGRDGGLEVGGCVVVWCEMLRCVMWCDVQ